MFCFRKIVETKHYILIVNQPLGLKEALTSRIVFWRSFSSSVLFLHYRRGNASTCSHLKSEMVTAYTIPSLSPYLAMHHIVPSSFYKLHPPTQKFCIALSFKKGNTVFAQNYHSRHIKYFGETNLLSWDVHTESTIIYIMGQIKPSKIIVVNQTHSVLQPNTICITANLNKVPILGWFCI